MIRRRKMRLYNGEFWDILRSIFSGRVARGKYIEKFEGEFAKYIGAQNAIATCAGRNGMELIFEALGLEEQDEIILPAYTLRDLVYLIQSLGYVPVLVDIKEDTFNIDPELIQKAITPRTKVIIATHMFGAPCMIEEIKGIADQNGIAVVEDCAHAAGAEYDGKKVGTFGIAAFFSFETIKPINTFGGGMVTTNDSEVAQLIRSRISQYPFESRRIIFKVLYTYFEHFVLHSPVYIFITFLFKSKIFNKLISKTYLFIHAKSRINRFRYSNVQALIGLKQLKEVEGKNRLRKEKADYFDNLLKKDIGRQRVLPHSRSVYYYYVITMNRPFSEVKRALVDKGLDIGVGDEITDDCSRIVDSPCPITKRVFDHAIQIPFYDDLKISQIEYIAEYINA